MFSTGAVCEDKTMCSQLVQPGLHGSVQSVKARLGVLNWCSYLAHTQSSSCAGPPRPGVCLTLPILMFGTADSCPSSVAVDYFPAKV